MEGIFSSPPLGLAPVVREGEGEDVLQAPVMVAVENGRVVVCDCDRVCAYAGDDEDDRLERAAARDPSPGTKVVERQ